MHALAAEYVANRYSAANRRSWCPRDRWERTSGREIGSLVVLAEDRHAPLAAFHRRY